MRVLVLTAMYPTAEKPATGTFVKQQVDSLLAAGIDVEVMAFEGERSLLNYLKAGLQLRRKLARESFDLVHAHYGLTGLPARMQFGLPVVITYHGSDLLGEVDSRGRYTRKGRGKVLLGKILGKLVQGRIVVAPILQDKLWGSPSHIIPMGVDLEAFTLIPQDQARQELGLDQQARYVLFLADPANGVKRFDVAKAACERLQEALPEARLLPVTGIPHGQIPLYLNACDVLILTSNHEASPCVVKEALACNLPVVSVDVGDVAERIAGVPGCAVCPREPGALAGALAQAIQTGKTPAGRAKVEAISLHKTALATIEVYAEVLEKA